MGGSSSQTVGYKYFAGLQVVIGGRIEMLLGINPDNRGWILPNNGVFFPNQDYEDLPIYKPNLFGGDKGEGGWVGMINIHVGLPNPLQDTYLAVQDSELVSSFPYLSYIVYHGADIVTNTLTGEQQWVKNQDKGFQLVSMSGMLKEVLYWVKRIHVKDDGSPQWYDEKAEIGTTETVAVPGEITPFSFSTFRKTNYDGIETTNSEDKHYILENAYVAQVNNYYTVGRSFNNGIVNEGIIAGVGANGLVRVNGSVVQQGDSNILIERLEESSAFLTFTYNITQEVIDGLLFKTYEFNGLASLSGADVSVSVILDGTGYIDSISFSLNINIEKPLLRYEIRTDFLDMNPIHKIREIITDDTAMNKPESMINDANFKAAADRIWDEGLGVSGAFTEKSCKEAIDELLYHIEAGIRVNRQTGLYEIVLFRDDLLDLDNAQVFDKSNIKNFSIETANIDDVINSVNVNYYDRDNIKDSSFSLDEIGSILSNQSNAETLDFPYFMNRRNAELVGNWKLKQLSTPTRKGTFTTGKYDARKINRYDVVKLTWHNQNMIEVPIRIMKIGLGDGRDNTVTLDWVEVIPYSSIVFPTINVDPPTSNVLPPQPNQSIAFEMPYFEAVQRFGQTQVDTELANNPDLGYLMVATKKPQNNSINALLFTDNGTGYQQTSIIDYCPVVQLDQDISYLDASFAVKNVSAISQAEIGTLILCDQELMVYQSYDDVTKILTVKRAALDTVPKPHLQDAVFYFYDAFNAFDSEQYVLSEVIDAKVLTTTPSGVQGLGDATALSVEMDARAIRPYPPANVKINDEYYPIDIETDLIVTWVDRNRLQQTGGSILGWTDGGVTIESGTSTMLTIKELDVDDLLIATHNIDATGTNTYTLAISSMQAETRSIEVTAKTVRDGYECLQPYEHIFELSQFFSAPYDLTVEFKND